MKKGAFMKRFQKSICVFMVIAILATTFSSCMFYQPGTSNTSIIPQEYLMAQENIFSNRTRVFTGGQTEEIDTLGFLSIENGHFYYETGDRAKFWGVNIAFEGCMPQKEEAERIVMELQALGVNSVRLLSFDTGYATSIFADANNNTLTLDPQMLDRMDYFIFCLKDAGIHTVLCVYAERNFTENDGVTQASELPAGGKYASLFDPTILALQKDFARTILTHQNPYTGLTYAQDPGIALYQVTNENSLFAMWYNGECLPTYYEEQLDDLFLAWLNENYGNAQTRISEWEMPNTILRPLYRDRENYSPLQIEDLMRFYMQVEEDYAQQMMDFYHDDLGVQAPVCVNTAYSGDLNLISTSAQDFTSAHMYYDYMEFSDDTWSYLDFNLANTSMLQTEPIASENITSLLGMVSFSALAGKPLILDEFNSIYPNDYQYEIIPIVTAYASFQDWDGLFLFSYSYGETGKTIGKHTSRRDYAINDFFLIENNAVKVSQMRICATLFLREDIAPAQTFYTLHTTTAQCLIDGDEQIYTSAFNNYGLTQPVSSNAVYTYGLRRELNANIVSPTPGALLLALGDKNNSIVSDTKELLWQNELFVINTPKTIALVGNLAKQNYTFDVCSMSAENGGAILITSLDDTALGESEHILFSASGRIENTGTERNTQTGGLLSWGEDALSVEGIRANITLQMPYPNQNYILYGLSADQVRLSEKTVTTDENGYLHLQLEASYLCYEITPID